MWAIFVPFLLIASIAPEIEGALRVPISVQENQGVDVNDYPTSVVVPLPKGNTYTLSNLGMEDIPSQVEPLEWWPSDKSLRHVMVHFQASVTANGSSQYHFIDRTPVAPSTPVTALETSDLITVDTGKIKFTVNKRSFNLINELWVDRNGNGSYEEGEKVIVPSNLNGGHLVPRSGAGSTQYDSARTDVAFDVEEDGPIRVVIRAAAKTNYRSTTDHEHGFAVRLYAYANQPYVKVDYQLQNSDKDVKRSWPLYFEALNVDLSLVGVTSPIVTFGSVDGGSMSVTGGGYLAQERHDRFAIYNQGGSEVHRRNDMDYQNDFRNGNAFMTVSEGATAVSVIGRYFWQMWPNGFQFGDGTMRLELFPSWSAQWEQGDGAGQQGRVSPTGMYWLKDMQHVYKEMLLVFHSDTVPLTDEVRNLASTFQFHPVAWTGVDWQRTTEASYDLGGYVPSFIAELPTGRMTFDSYYNQATLDPDSGAFSFTVRAFGDPEVGYRNSAYTAGGWPYSTEGFLSTGLPDDYFLGEIFTIGELNVRPQWLAEYQFDSDQAFLQLTTNPYPPNSWRVFDGWGYSLLDADPIAGTDGIQPDMISRDDAHGWFYHVGHSYWYTGSLWVKDWYEFIREFRKVRLSQGDPFPDMADRALGHSLNHAYQAARVVGDSDFAENLLFYLRFYLRPNQDLQYGQQISSSPDAGGGFQTGYLTRSIIDYMEHVRDVDVQAYAEAFQYLSGHLAWNLHYGNFTYYANPSTNPNRQTSSSGTSLTLVDPQSWYYWHTGRQEFWAQIIDYIDDGINGGERPYGSGFSDWSGQFEGRVYHYVLETTRVDKTPPAAITDLVARKSGNTVQLQWTTPSEASHFHIVYSDRLISEAQTTNTAVHNWWAADTVGANLVGIPGMVQLLNFEKGSEGRIYAAVFSFDEADNMSAMSNVALAIDEPLLPLGPTPAPAPKPSPAPAPKPSPAPSVATAPTARPTAPPTSPPASSPTIPPSTSQLTGMPTPAPIITSIRPGSNCFDIVLGWYDAEGPAFTCAWYAQYSGCEEYGDRNANFGHTAKTNCCACGGGWSKRSGPFWKG